MMKFAGFVIALAFIATAAEARWKPQYASAPQEIQDWYRNAELTEAAQRRFGFKSCCAKSDVVRTRFRPSADGDDGWDYLDGDTWRRVPPDIVHEDKFAPGGQPILFAVDGKPTCFFKPSGGL
jgi:hypothetical protein